MTRFYHSTNTRYNIHFNANEAYKETLKSRLQSREDNLSEMLYVFPDNSDSVAMQLPGGSFTTTIDKTTKAIKLHSIKVKPRRDPKRRNDTEYQAWVQQKEFTPFMDKVWLLLAKAEFHEANYLKAITTFLYITKIYSSQPGIVAECNLWIARAYTEMGWLYEAGNVLHKMELAGGPPDKHKGFYEAVKANYLIRNKDYTAAVPHLEFAIQKEKDKHQRLRMKYLLGQIYTETGDKTNADKAFASVQGMNTPYKFSFNAKLNQLQLNASANSQKNIASLNSMANSSKNKEYLDQLYLSIGNIYLQNSDTTKAIDNYRKAIKESTRNGYDKAMAQVTLGDLYFDKREFVLAQPNYSEALPQLKKSHPEYAKVALRSDVLDELVVHVKTVYEQDSLQYVAQLPEEDRLKIIHAKIDEEKKKEEKRKKEEDRQKQEENRQDRISTWADMETAMQSNKNQPVSNVPQINAAGKQGDANAFYFYNDQAVSQGKIAFQRQWGTRKLEDDWRRRDKTGGFSDFAEADIINETDSLLAEKPEIQKSDSLQTTAISNDIFSVEYYLQQLPFTEEAILQSNTLIENALFNMGLIYKNKLEDNNLAIDAFNTDIRRFPATPNLEEIYYQLFLIYMQEGNRDMMASYRDKLIREFPDKVYAKTLSHPDYEWNFRHMPAMVDSLYSQAFDAYQQADVQTIRNNYNEINRRYPLTGLMPQFTMLNALSYAQTRDAKELTDNLTELVNKYPKSEVTPLAEDILKKIKDGQPLLSDGSPITGFDWSLANPADSTMTGGDSRTLAFSDSPDTEYLLLLMFRSNTIDRNELLYEVADYNFSNYVIQTYDLSFETNPPYDILQIKGFNKFANIRSYLNRAFTEDGLFNKIDTSIVAIPISTDNYTKVLPRLGMEQYTTFFAEHFQDQLPILIAHWNKNTSEIENLMAEVTQPQQEEQVIDKTEEVKAEETEITPEIKVEPKVITDNTKQPEKQTQQPVNDKQITADDLLTDTQRQTLGKADDVVKSVEEVLSNPVDGIRGLFNKYKNRESLTKEEKEARKEEEKLEKQRQKELKALAKVTQDSIRRIEKNRTDSIARVEKAVQDSIETTEKQRKEQLRLEEQAKKNAEKAAVKAREDERKRKEDERKEKIRQQQERLRQQEQERKEKEKAREQERKEKERLQKERQRQREKERDEKEKAHERERKEKEKRRNQ